MKILVVGDLHGDASTAGVARFDDVARSLRAAAGLAVEERCDGLVQLGDLCDPGPQASRCAALAIEVASRLSRAGIWNRWLVGNHDVVEDGAGLSTLAPLARFGEAQHEAGLVPAGWKAAPVRPLCAVWSGPTAEFLDHERWAVALPHPARGAGYDPVEFVRELRVGDEVRGMDLLPRERVLVFGHLVVPGMQPGGETLDMPRGREVLFPVAECLARWGERCVLVDGHYHRASRRADGPVLVPGSVERLTKGEAGNTPGVLILEV